MKKPNKPGKKVGDYILIKELGSGAFGEVYKAQHRSTEEILAIKCIPRFKLKQHNGMVQTLLENEISVLQKIKNDNVVKFVQYMESPNQCYIVTEYCNGGDLLHYWDQRGECLPESEVILMLKQLLQGMKALHEQNIIHRDLKLSNILRHNGIIKISDFGFSKQLKTSQGQEILRLGTLGYMAPEIILKQPYGLEVDMFSLGVVIYQLLMGRLPFDNSSDQNFIEDVTNNKVDFEPPLGVKISKEFKSLIEQMLQLDRKNRMKWSDLYLNPLILAKQKFSDPVSQASIQADKLNAEMSHIFYQDKELSLQFSQHFSNQHEIQQVDEEENYITQQQILEIQLQDEEQSKVTDTQNKFFDFINNIPFLKTYLLLNQIQCPKDPCIYFVTRFILIKRMYFLQMKFIKKIEEQYDFFKVGKNILNQLNLLPQFWDFREQQENQKTEIRNEFNEYLQSWHVNQATLEFKEYDFRNWRKELCLNEPSEQFSQIFREILEQFKNTFQTQIQQGPFIVEHFQIFEYLQQCQNYVILYLFKAFFDF